ncbi:MAG: hypothetical protein II047_00155, partial [Bacteroidales bacterium]|nr:hypothetical protein [Bacteroidales bacterium]
VSDSLCDKYGRLYSWSAAVDSAGFYSSDALGCGYYVMESNCGKKENNSRVRGVCPEGWHLPTYNEYETLFRYVGGMSVAGKMLKSTSGWEEGKTGSILEKVAGEGRGPACRAGFAADALR